MSIEMGGGFGQNGFLLKVALLSTQLDLPHEGCLQQAYHIFGYMNKSPRQIVFMGPDHPHIDESRLNKFDSGGFLYRCRGINYARYAVTKG